MPEITKKVLVLTFGCENGKELNLTINSPKEDLSAAEVKAAMEAITASGALGEESIVSKTVAAKYVSQQVDAITLA